MQLNNEEKKTNNKLEPPYSTLCHKSKVRLIFSGNSCAAFITLVDLYYTSPYKVQHVSSSSSPLLNGK